MDTHECVTNCSESFYRFNYQCSSSSCPNIFITEGNLCKCKYKFATREDIHGNTIIECYPENAECPPDKQYLVENTSECIDADTIRCPEWSYKDVNAKQCKIKCDKFRKENINECISSCNPPGYIFGINEGYILNNETDNSTICYNVCPYPLNYYDRSSNICYENKCGSINE